MKNVFHSTLQSRQEQAARRHANFDKSDPHTYNRAVSHIHNGVVGFRSAKVHGKDAEVHALYDADTFPGTRDVDPRWEPLRTLSSGRVREVPVTVYKNVCKP